MAGKIPQLFGRVFPSKDGDVHERTVSLPEGNGGLKSIGNS